MAMLDEIVSKTVRSIKGQKDPLGDIKESAKLQGWWQQAENARRKSDQRWFEYDLWTNGYHYAKFDRSTKQIVTAPQQDGLPKVTINKIYTTLRGVRSFVLQNRPKPQATPVNYSEEHINETIKINQYLDYLYDRLHMRTKLRASMWHALKYSVGFWQVLYDDDADDGAGEVSIDVVDPYDLYWDPNARYPSEARFVILAVKRSIEDLKKDPKYKDADWTTVEEDSKGAASTLKAQMLRIEDGDVAMKDKKGDGTAIVKEFWYKEEGEEKEEEEEPTEEETDDVEEKPKKEKSKKKTTKIYLCTMIGETIIRKSFDTGLTRFPFFRLPSDIEPLKMYGTGWVKNMISPNRELNRVESSIAEYNLVVNKARLITEKGSGIKTITNQHGQIIEVKRGFRADAFNTPQLGSEADSARTVYNRYLEDMGSLHDASMGRATSADQSGRSIEALQEGDSNNLSELLENIEEFLEDVFEYVLDVVAQKQQFAKRIVTTTQTGQKEAIQIIGEDAQESVKNVEGATVIPKKTLVDVRITSNLAYTAEGRRMAVKDLASILPDLPPEVILDAYSVGPAADIVKQMKVRQKEQQEQEANMQQQQSTNQIATQATQQQMQQEAQTNSGAGALEAQAVIRSIINRQVPQLPQNVSPEFINYLDQFMESEEGQAQGGQFLSVLQQLRDQSMLQMRGNVDNVKQGT